jgi:hypothetical protein
MTPSQSGREIPNLEAVIKALAAAENGTRTLEADVTGAPRANANYQLGCQTTVVLDVVERLDIRPGEIEISSGST